MRSSQWVISTLLLIAVLFAMINVGSTLSLVKIHLKIHNNDVMIENIPIAFRLIEYHNQLPEHHMR